VTGQRSILILKSILKHNNSLGNILFNLFQLLAVASSLFV
jgi:hypothetical protein